MLDNNKPKQPVRDTGLVTSWRLAIPAFASAFLTLLLILGVSILCPFSPESCMLILSLLCGASILMLWCKRRWFSREALAQKAIALLKLTPESARLDVKGTMRAALSNDTFIRGLQDAINGSAWRLKSDTSSVARWEIELPQRWGNTDWNWCAFGLICAARPSDVSCTNASRVGQLIILELSTKGEIVPRIRLWEKALSIALGTKLRIDTIDYDSVNEEATLNLSENITAEQTSAPNVELSPWREQSIIEPEGIVLTMWYDGAKYFAQTSKDGKAQISEYLTWIAMWETWHFFEEADALLSNHSVS